MSAAIPPNPNAIIRALLDIAQAAYVLIHSPGKDMADNLKKQVNVLEDLPQYCNNPVNLPCRASKYLESFLVGGSTMTTTGADVQRDGTEFKEHTWNAPVESPPQKERRLRERMIEPTTPGRDEKAVDPVVEANRELLLSRSKVGIEKYGVTLASAGLSKRELLTHALQESLDLANYLQAELQRSDAERYDARTNMLADTADEALRIINDAGLLKNLAWMLTTRDPGTTVKIYQSSRENAATPWCLNVHEEGQVARHYRSTSLHQLIAVAHKGEQDHEYPEPD